MLRDLNQAYTGGKRRLGLCTCGIRGDQIPNPDPLNPPWMYPSLALPADAAKEYMYWIEAHNFPFGLPLDDYSAGVITGLPDGVYSATVLLEENGVPLGTFPAQYTVGSLAGGVAIVTQPAPRIVAAGQPAQFSVVVGGTAPFSYQWLRNGVPIPGATGAIYTLAAPTTEDSGAVFSVVCGNTVGGTPYSVTSSGALLTVLGALDMFTLRAPQDQYTHVGGFAPKDPAATLWLVFDFRRYISAPANPVVTLTRLAGPDDGDPSAMKVGQPVVGGTLVFQKVTGGVENCDYAVRCEADGAGGTRYPMEGLLPVRPARA
jgi:hypothetical protein